MLSIVRLSPRYQLTLPQEVRQALRCEPNDRIAFRSDESGRIYIENMKAVDIPSVRGLLRREELEVATDGTEENPHSRVADNLSFEGSMYE